MFTETMKRWKADLQFQHFKTFAFSNLAKETTMLYTYLHRGTPSLPQDMGCLLGGPWQ